MAQLFVKSSRIQKAASLINKLDDSKFPLLLVRIVQKLHLKEEIFTKEEIAKLEVSLSVSQEELRLILQTLTFIFQQASYHLAKPNILTQQLQNIDLNITKAAAITQVWINNASNVTENLKNRTIAEKQLKDVNWELHLQLADSNESKQKIPLGIMELELDSDGKTEKLQIEFTREELYSLYNQVEMIQSQLDALR